MADKKSPAVKDPTRALLERAHKGDKTCVDELQTLFADGSKGARLVDYYGSPAKWLADDITGSVAGDNLAIREATAKKLAQVRADLAGPAPTPIERLLAERAAVCWFLVNRYEWAYANAKDLSFRQADHHQSKIDRAHRRFLTALKTLASVRKLALPAIQVNIADKQVNVTNGNA